MLTSTLITLLVAQTQSPSLSQGRSWVKQFYEGNTATLWTDAGQGLRRQMGTAGGLEAFSKSVAASFGAELRVISEGMSSKGDHTIYKRTGAFSRWARGVEVELEFDETGKVAAIAARPAASAAPTAYGAKKTQVTLRLPVEGPWFVLWGGRTWDLNRHAAVSDMRYAIDFLISRGGGSFKGNGAKNDQYWAWGKSVLAPADGVVVFTHDGEADNVPNHANPLSLYGNYIVVDHGSGEYSLFGHLQQGSVQVRVGDKVSQGRVIARVGSSGMSTEPHLHYQLMDKPDWLVANGLPAQFQNFLRDGKLVDRGEPRRADTVEQAELAASNDI